jgi:hypothetical protein
MIVMAFVIKAATKSITIMKTAGSESTQATREPAASAQTSAPALTMIVSGFGTDFGIKSTHDHEN